MTKKTLILVRHGHAQNVVSEHDMHRKLTSKGEKQATEIALELNELNVRPDLIISSPANRADETADIISQNLKHSKTTKLTVYNLYEADEQEYRDIIAQTPEHIDTLMVVGHNPTVSNLAASLSPIHAVPLRPGSVLVFKTAAATWSTVFSKAMEAVEFMEFN